jgi:hypothetical protein
MQSFHLKFSLAIYTIWRVNIFMFFCEILIWVQNFHFALWNNLVFIFFNLIIFVNKRVGIRFFHQMLLKFEIHWKVFPIKCIVSSFFVRTDHKRYLRIWKCKWTFSRSRLILLFTFWFWLLRLFIRIKIFVLFPISLRFLLFYMYSLIIFEKINLYILSLNNICNILDKLTLWNDRLWSSRIKSASLLKLAILIC